MKQLPESDIYEQELFYMPYRDSLNYVLHYIVNNAPKNVKLLDIMCGPGYLLDKISKLRPDLVLTGVDIDKRYIKYSLKKYPSIKFEVADILKWNTNSKFDVVICTGSLHHIPYNLQERATKIIASSLRVGGMAIISDCYIKDFENETERKINAAKLGYEYLRETISNGAPKEVIKATIDILDNDVMMNEFKTSINKRLPILKKYFKNVRTVKIWPKRKSEYGDYISYMSR